MFYRSVAALIVIFWIAMTALLFRKELATGANALSEIPARHVMNQMFIHGEASDLNVYSDRQMVGQLRIHPHLRSADGMRVLEFSGRLSIAIPGAPRQRVAWAGQMEWDRALAMRTGRFQLNLAEPSPSGVTVLIDPRSRRVYYETHLGGKKLDHGEYPMSAQGAVNWMRDLGIDPALLQSGASTEMPSLQVSAWLSSMLIHEQKLETYRVVVEYGGQTLVEFHVNKIGQILQAKTFLGYTAGPDDMVPP